MSDIPEKNTRQWVKNEKLINQDPALKKARDTAEGIAKPDRYYKQTHGGKGSAPRINTQSQQWRDNWDRIFGAKNQKEKQAEVTDLNHDGQEND